MTSNRPYGAEAASATLESLSSFNASLFPFPGLTHRASAKRTCEHNHSQCSQNAFCTDYATGFCCHCQSQFHGDGQHCLPAGEALARRPGAAPCLLLLACFQLPLGALLVDLVSPLLGSKPW